MENYELLSQIGKGNFGSISKIKRKSDNKILVWKELDYGKMSEKEKQHIVAEVNILRELKHPNIVKYYDRIIDKKNTRIYIIMEFCEGGDIGALIKRCKKIKEYVAEDVIWKIFTQIILALHECHTRKEGKIIHRDLKPSNVFLDGENNIKLGDFGLSRMLSNESVFAYSHVGTPYYMSPEQIDEKRYNEKSDIWSLGCFLYEISSFNPPFEATNHLALALKIKSGKVDRIPSRYSEELQRVINWTLSVEQNQRPTIEDLLNLPQVSLRLRERRLKDSMIKLKKLEENLKEKQSELEEKEKKIEERLNNVVERENQVKELERLLNDKEIQFNLATGNNPNSISENNTNNQPLTLIENISSTSFNQINPNPNANSTNSYGNNAYTPTTQGSGSLNSINQLNTNTGPSKNNIFQNLQNVNNSNTGKSMSNSAFKKITNEENLKSGINFKDVNNFSNNDGQNPENVIENDNNNKGDNDECEVFSDRNKNHDQQNFIKLKNTSESINFNFNKNSQNVFLNNDVYNSNNQINTTENYIPLTLNNNFFDNQNNKNYQKVKNSETKNLNNNIIPNLENNIYINTSNIIPVSNKNSTKEINFNPNSNKKIISSSNDIITFNSNGTINSFNFNNTSKEKNLNNNDNKIKNIRGSIANSGTFTNFSVKNEGNKIFSSRNSSATRNLENINNTKNNDNLNNVNTNISSSINFTNQILDNKNFNNINSNEGNNNNIYANYLTDNTISEANMINYTRINNNRFNFDSDINKEPINNYNSKKIYSEREKQTSSLEKINLLANNNLKNFNSRNNINIIGNNLIMKNNHNFSDNKRINTPTSENNQNKYNAFLNNDRSVSPVCKLNNQKNINNIPLSTKKSFKLQNK